MNVVAVRNLGSLNIKKKKDKKNLQFKVLTSTNSQPYFPFFFFLFFREREIKRITRNAQKINIKIKLNRIKRIKEKK